jgi:hypothetical protein
MVSKRSLAAVGEVVWGGRRGTISKGEEGRRLAVRGGGSMEGGEMRRRWFRLRDD